MTEHSQDPAVDPEDTPFRYQDFLQRLYNVVFKAINVQIGSPDDMTDEQFENVVESVLSLISATLANDLEVFDFSDLNPKRNLN